MREMKKGKLRSSSGAKVTNPKQAIAIGLSEAREAGAAVPELKRQRSKKAVPKKAAKKKVSKKAAPKKSTTSKSTAKKVSSKK